MYFRNYGLQKPWVDKCRKSPVSEDSSKSNMINGCKHCLNQNPLAPLAYLLINVKALKFGKVSVSDRQNSYDGFITH